MEGEVVFRVRYLKLLEGLGGAGLGERVQDHITAFTLKGQRTGRCSATTAATVITFAPGRVWGTGGGGSLYINQPIHINGGYMTLPS